MNADTVSRRLCVDRPDGMPHVVDEPRAHRCEQHRSQRRRWNNANWWRRRHDLSPLPWVPDPLTPDRRQAAARQFANRNADDIRRSTTLIRLALHAMRDAKKRLPPQHWQHVDIGIHRITALVNDIDNTTRVM